VKNRFQNSPFKCNLQRYTAADSVEAVTDRWGELYNLNPVDPQLERRPVSTLGTYEVKKRFQSLPLSNAACTATDRLKMQVYIGCAMVGIPCPITGNNGAIGQEAVAPNTTAPES
jgi:hypothetical protein